MRISDWSSDVCSSDLLAVVDFRRLELGDVERRQAAVQAEAALRLLEAVRQQVGVDAAATLSQAELRLVEATPAGVAHQLQHLRLAVREVRLETLGEQTLDLQRQEIGRAHV